MPKTAKRKVEFWWASIAGANAEPVEVTTIDGERVAYTCGCGDPFYLDRPGSLVKLMSHEYEWGDDGNKKPLPMERPLTPRQKAAEQRKYEAQLKLDRALGISHSWRGPR